MHPSEAKKAIRQRIKELKSNHSPGDLKQMSSTIVQQIEQHERFKAAKCVMAYWSLPDEVDTHQLIKRWSGEKQFVLPVIKGRTLELRQFQGEEQMYESRYYGIMEPAGPAFTDYSSIDFVVVPGLAFTADGSRLGYGGGYYDRLLPQLVNALKVAVAFPFQMVEEIPMAPYDVQVDEVVWGET